jgi:lipopolysaccharide transport system permease protein
MTMVQQVDLPTTAPSRGSAAHISPGDLGGRQKESTPAARPLMVIRPPRVWQLINVRELWQFRELIYFMAWRDVKVRYKQTLLGAAWAVLQPAMMMVVFTIFFNRMGGIQSKGDVPYPVFVYAGLLPWTFFAAAIASAGNSIVGSERLITKVYFPRLAVPFGAVGASVVDLVIAFGLLLVLMVATGVTPGASMLLLPLLCGLILLAALGVGTLLAALNVAYRDFRYVIPFLVQIWMFATPTVYMQPAEGGKTDLIHLLMALNPMTALVGAFRAAALGDPIPWGQVGIATALVLVVFAGACLYFRKVEDKLADII